jgi:hypothetical protein
MTPNMPLQRIQYSCADIDKTDLETEGLKIGQKIAVL